MKGGRTKGILNLELHKLEADAVTHGTLHDLNQPISFPPKPVVTLRLVEGDKRISCGRGFLMPGIQPGHSVFDSSWSWAELPGCLAEGHREQNSRFYVPPGVLLLHETLP
jgi:hypothetical protein